MVLLPGPHRPEKADQGLEVGDRVPCGEEVVQAHLLAASVGEDTDVATAHPAIVEKARTIMREGRTKSAEFPLRD